MFSYLSRLFSLLSFRILLITLSYAKKQKKDMLFMKQPPQISTSFHFTFYQTIEIQPRL